MRQEHYPALVMSAELSKQKLFIHAKELSHHLSRPILDYNKLSGKSLKDN